MNAALRSTALRLRRIQRDFPLMQLLALLVIFLYGAVAIDGFAAKSSLYSMLVLAAILGIASVGQTFVVLTGGIDLSIPGFIVVGATMTAMLTGTDHWPFALTLAAIAAVSGAGGALNGWICHRFRIQSLVVTLAMGAIVAGAMLVWSNGTTPSSVPLWIGNLTSAIGRTFGVGIPPVVVIWVVVAVVVEAALRWTLAGRRMYASGSNPVAAELVLIKTGRTRVATFALSAVSAAIAGVLLAGFAGGAPQNLGDPYLWESLTAVIVGGTALAGARGDYLRTALGCLLLTALSTVLIGQGFSTADQEIVYGALILVVVAGYGRDRRLRDRV
jgi:ribose transport system permease protein